jgi:flagellar basal-body rod modification protein FlgD
MQVNVTSSTPAAATTSASSASATSSTGNSTLSETQFLQLLTEQLENQDPLQPEDDTQFLSQMAQFTALQETNTLNQQVQNLTAGSYIGSTVTVNPGTTLVTGQVTGVDTSGATPQLVINGSEYPLAELQMVDPTAAASAAASGSSQTQTQTPSSTPAAAAIKAVAALLKPNS